MGLDGGELGAERGDFGGGEGGGEEAVEAEGGRGRREEGRWWRLLLLWEVRLGRGGGLGGCEGGFGGEVGGGEGGGCC